MIFVCAIGRCVISYSLYKELNISLGKQTEFAAVIISFAKLLFGVKEFQESLNHQKHAFYFRKVRKWVACVRVSVKLWIVSGIDMYFMKAGLPKLLGIARGLLSGKQSLTASIQLDLTVRIFFWITFAMSFFQS